MQTTGDKKNDMHETKVAAPGSNALGLMGESAFMESRAELLTSRRVSEKGICSLYKDDADRYFVRTATADADITVGVSGRAAARILEWETRQRLDALVSARLDVPVRVKDDAGKIYDTAKDKLHFKSPWYYEAVSGHETEDGCLYFRFVDAYKDRIMILKDPPKEIERYVAKSTNEEAVAYMSWCVELWCGSDRSFLTLLDKAGDCLFHNYEIIAVVEKEEEYPWTHSLQDKGENGSEPL